MNVRCYLCNGSQYKKLFVCSTGEQQFFVVQCYACGLAFTAPQLGIKEQAAHYEPLYYQNRKPFVDKFLNRLRERRVKSILTAGSLLDVGCGTGSFLACMHARGWETTGTEVSPAYDFVALQNQGIRVERRDLTDCGFVADSFDVVTMWHVLEHLTDPGGYLEGIKKVIKPDGALLIEVPNFASWQARVGGPYWFHLDVPRHTMHFTPASMTKFLESAGFTVIRIRAGSMFYDLFGDVQTWYNRFFRRQNLLFDIIGGRARISRHMRDIFFMFLLAPFIGLYALCILPFAAIFGKSGTMLVYAKKVTIQS